MITPTETIAPQQALLAVGAQVLLAGEHQPLTVTQAWVKFQNWRTDHNHHAPVPFWWFVLALDVLYALGTVELQEGVLVFQKARELTDDGPEVSPTGDLLADAEPCQGR